MFNDWWSIVDILFVGIGLYMLYSCILMKTTGEIKTGFLMNRDVDLRKCKDLEGYKAFIFPKLLALAAMTLLYGLMGMINTYVTPIPLAVSLVAMAAFMAILVWFSLQSKKGIQMFW